MPCGPFRQQEVEKQKDLTDFELARPGDSLFVPFQWDDCIFQRLLRKDPNMNSASEKSLLMYIRIANIDAFWSRASSTVAKKWETAKDTFNI